MTFRFTKSIRKQTKAEFYSNSELYLHQMEPLMYMCLVLSEACNQE